MNIKKIHLSEPWFTLVMLGIKNVEGRLNKGFFKNLEIGDMLIFYNDDAIYREIIIKILDITIYNSFKEYLENESLFNCLPGYKSIDNGLKVYYKYYSREDEEIYKVKAFTLETKN
jgi:ASC-1-like (ASCH) protein